MDGDHDPSLIAALRAIGVEEFQGVVWRVAEAERDPLQPSVSAGRWSPNGCSTLYTALAPEGALADHAHAQKPAAERPPLLLHEIEVAVPRALVLRDMEVLQQLGVRAADYGDDQHKRCQEIGAAAAALDYDAVMAPNARWPCRNLALFLRRPLPMRLMRSIPVKDEEVA
jgi:RES domain-containing protein